MPVRSPARLQHLVNAGVYVLFCSCVAASVFAQISGITDSQSQTNLGGNNSIIGTVFSPSGRPLQQRVSIRLSTMTRGDRVFTTNENGAFAFRGLPSGSYTITIDREVEYKPYTTSVDVLQTGGGGRPTPTVVTVNIRLEYKDRNKVAVVNAELLSVPEKARNHYHKGMEESEKGNRETAIEEFKQAIAEYPSFTMAFNELGVQYLKLARVDEADQAFQNALRIDPDSFPALTNRGIANVMMKRYGEAVPILRKALEKNDQLAVCHYFLGQALANLGLFDEAEKELVVSLKLGKEQMKEAHRILAIIYSSRRANKQAAKALETYLKLAPDTPDADQIKERIRRLKEN
jgi:Flp pilus assembly protein TadD